MGIGGLSEMLGMGLTIQLRNMFSIPAMAIEKSSRAMTSSILGDQKAINNGFRLMAGGGALMLVGTGIIAGFGMLAKFSLEASSNMELLRKQIILLAKSEPVGGALFDRMKQFSLTTPFTIDKIMAGGKSLLAMGFTADRVMGQMKNIGDWSSMVSNLPIDEAATIIGKIRTGNISQAMRRLQSTGIGYKDIALAGGPIDPRTHMTKKGADPEEFLKAVNKVIEQKFAGGMKIYMTTLPGMLTNLQDQLIYFRAQIGDQFKQSIKDMLMSVIGVFKPDLIIPFAKALGDGVQVILKMLQAVLLPLAHFVVWIMQLSKEHPGLVKFGVAGLFLVGVLIDMAGAAMILVGAFYMIQFLLTSAAVATLGESLLAMMGPLGWVIAGLGLFYVAWSNNFMNIRSVLMYFWDSFQVVFSGVSQLFTSINNGVGTMSKGTADALGKAGLLGVATQLFMILYRVYKFAQGVWDGIMVGVKVIAFLGSVVIWLTTPVWELFYILYKVGEALGWVGNLVSSDKWRAFGEVVGVLATTFIFARGMMYLWTIATGAYGMVAASVKGGIIAFNSIVWLFHSATKAATLAQWLLNAAMAANPVGLLIFSVAALIGLLVLWYKHNQQITAWFHGLPIWAKYIFTLFQPLIGIPLLIISNWERIKGWFTTFGDWLGNLWDTLIIKIVNKILWMWNGLRAIIVATDNWATGGRGGADQNLPKFSPLLSNDQMNKLVPTKKPEAETGVGSVGAVHDSYSRLAQAIRSQVIKIDNVITLDGRAVGRAVSDYQRNLADGGTN